MLLKSTKIIQILKETKNFTGGEGLKFSLIFEIRNKILAEIHNPDNKKAFQESDIPVKIIVKIT